MGPRRRRTRVRRTGSDPGHHFLHAGPVDGSAAALSCLVEAIYEGGDHWIVVGRVAAFQRREDGVAPLVFHAGRYVGLEEKTPQT